ncbi:MAG: HdeD family acid-resistance protein [Chloroflexi bacterium OHK40]
MTTATAAPPLSDRGPLPTWLVMILGVIYIVLGALLITQPLASTLALVIYIGAAWFVGGVMDLLSLFRDRSQWLWKAISGGIGIWAGLAVLGQPLLSTVLVPVVFIIVLGVTGLIGGIVRIVQALRGGGWGIGILGALTIILSLMLLSEPVAGAVVLPFVLGITAIVGGVLTLLGPFIRR